MLSMLDLNHTHLILDISTNKELVKFQKVQKIKHLTLRYEVDIGLLNKFTYFKHIDLIDI